MTEVKLLIRDQNDNIIFETKATDKCFLDAETQKKIYDCVASSDSSVFIGEIFADDLSYGYNSVQSKFSRVILPKHYFKKELPELFSLFNKHVAALLVCHSSMGVVGGARCGVGGVDVVGAAGTVNTADTADTIGTADAADTADTIDTAGTINTAGTVNTADTADIASITNKHPHKTDVMQEVVQKLADQLDENNIIHNKRHNLSHSENSEKQDSEQTLNNFITYLHTYNTLAELIQDLQLLQKQPTNNQHIIRKYKKWASTKQAPTRKNTEMMCEQFFDIYIYVFSL